MRTLLRVLILSIFYSAPASAYAQGAATQAAQTEANRAKPEASDDLLKRLPPDLRGRARTLLTFNEEQQKYFATLSDEDLRVSILTSLATKPEAVDFVFEQLEKEGSAKARARIVALVQYQKYYPHLAKHPRAIPILERLAAADPSVEVSLKALESLRVLRMGDGMQLLLKRLELARTSNAATDVKQLAAEHERWIMLEAGVMLPSFLRKVPPTFAVPVKSGDQPVRVLAFGDFGTGSDAQKQTAAAIQAYHRQTPFDFALTLGDNFYPIGMTSTDDPRWKTQWEDLYGPLGITFYTALGNHDWGHPDSPAAEILYSVKSTNWRMPSPYYTFTAGPVQFFAIDTQEMSEAQLMWLDEEIGKSRARWKVVYGHFHIYSATRGDNETMIAKLLPLLKNRVDLYLCGHDHNLQHVQPEGGVHFVVAGGGGAGTYKTKPYPRSIVKYEDYGFAVLEVTEKSLAFKLVNKDTKQLYQYTIQK